MKVRDAIAQLSRMDGELDLKINADNDTYDIQGFFQEGSAVYETWLYETEAIA